MPHPVPTRRRPLNPFLRRRVDHSGKRKRALTVVAGFTHYATLYNVLREDRVAATAQLVARLERLADAVQFPRDEIFLDVAR